MALTLIATAGAVDANSYCTVDESNSYHEAHVYGTNWVDEAAGFDSEVKEKALVWATRLLDEHFKWIGIVAGESQNLRWPRSYVYGPDHVEVDSTTIPQFLKDATAELARLLIGKDLTAELDQRGIKEVKVGSLGVEFDKYDAPRTMPRSVVAIVAPYVFSPQTRTLVRM